MTPWYGRGGGACAAAACSDSTTSSGALRARIIGVFGASPEPSPWESSRAVFLACFAATFALCSFSFGPPGAQQFEFQWPDLPQFVHWALLVLPDLFSPPPFRPLPRDLPPRFPFPPCEQPSHSSNTQEHQDCGSSYLVYSGEWCIDLVS